VVLKVTFVIKVVDGGDMQGVPDHQQGADVRQRWQRWSSAGR
jgi:hypothetical protein